MFEIGIAAGLALYFVFVLHRSTFRVEEGHLAVLVEFGKAETEGGARKLKTYGPGIHWKKPWKRTVIVSMKEQTLDLNLEDGGGTAMADDGTILRLDSFVRYVPVQGELYEFLFGLERPLDHITGLFTCLLRNEIANFRGREAASVSAETSLANRFEFASQAGSYALIRRERKLLNERIESFCRQKIDDRYGVRFNAVDLADILPPDELADALNAVIQAHSEADAHLHRAEAECQQRILSAERGVSIATARSQAIETEIRKLCSFLEDLDQNGVLDAYVARRRAEVTSESRTLFLKESVNTTMGQRS
ncbi:MAG TPA: SPFH domain-containing protein [Labilithrix sp.]|jgi:regulator of protease activity HflC (stomatin/prohibitin superfamily)|nr:SPFH domain-containing protein [Labilithrix sp.]